MFWMFVFPHIQLLKPNPNVVVGTRRWGQVSFMTCKHCYTLFSSFSLGILAIWSCTGQMPLATYMPLSLGRQKGNTLVADTFDGLHHISLAALMALPWHQALFFCLRVFSKVLVKGSARELNKSHLQRIRARWSHSGPVFAMTFWEDFVHFSETLLYLVLVVNSSDLYSTPFHTFLSQYFNFITYASQDYLPK